MIIQVGNNLAIVKISLLLNNNIPGEKKIENQNFLMFKI